MTEREKALETALRFYSCNCAEGACEAGNHEDTTCGETARAALSNCPAPADAQGVEPVNVDEVERIARVISLSYGEDPDEDAPMVVVCGPNNEPLPCWEAYREQAKAVVASLSPRARRAVDAPNDGSCVRCGCAPRNASGLCATCLDEDAVRAGELPEDAQGVEQAFERFPALTDHIQRMASTGNTGSIHEWSDFLACLNAAVSRPADAQGVEPDEGPTEWFWRIVDATGLGNVSSDEETALRELVAKAERYDQMLTAPPPDQARREALEAVLKKAIETLAASRHLIGRYVPDHQWLPEHDRRIAEIKAALASPAPAAAQKGDHTGLEPGWVAVPEEPTEAMIEAAVEDEQGWRGMPLPETRLKRHYRVMIAARPQPAAAQKGDEP